MRVRWTTDAADDLERISDYIADDRPEAARRIALHIVRTVDGLDTFPNRGRPGRVEHPRAGSCSPSVHCRLRGPRRRGAGAAITARRSRVADVVARRH